MAAAGEAELVPAGTPDEVRECILHGTPRVPAGDPTLGIPVTVEVAGAPRNRLVAIGDSLTHGFQSGAIFNTDISYPAIIATELGWFEEYRYPRYPGYGGLPLNIELLLRELEDRYGASLNLWERARAVFTVRGFMDRVEDYWERGPGATVPSLSTTCHDLAVYGWDLRDALDKTAASCQARIAAPNDDLLSQVVENNGERAALRVYPTWSKQASELTLFGAAAALGEEHDSSTDCGIETLVVALGANNALQSVTNLEVVWSQDDFADMRKKNAYTVWQPSHFAAEFAEVVEAVKAIKARHVIWLNVPHVTIAPIARGVGTKLAPGSRYYPYYTRPWVDDSDFNPGQDKNITGAQARAVDCAVDMYNDVIESAVRDARDGKDGTKRDWYLLDLSGLLDRLAARRYVTDPNARPAWWTPYPLPPALHALQPVPDSKFLTGDGHGGRATGGLFSLDGVHPTTVAYGIMAQEIIHIMRRAGVPFYFGSGQPRRDPVAVDFDRLVRRDTLVRRPPQNLNEGLAILGWADELVDLVRRTLSFRS